MRWSSVLAVVAVGALVATSCGSTSPTGSPASTTPSSPEPSRPERPFEAAAYPSDQRTACDTEGYDGQIGSIRALDARTVEFTLCAPDGSFLSKIASISLGIQDLDYLAETGGGGALVREPNGTGPYRLRAWHDGSDIEVASNPDYWGEAPRTATAIIRWVESPASRLLELEYETVDGIAKPPAEDLASIASNPAFVLHTEAAWTVAYLGLNDTIAPFDDPRVRRAIAIGIDRQRIVQEFFPAGAMLATHLVPCSVPGACSGEAWYAHDAAAAREILAEAGVEAGFSATLSLLDVGTEALPNPIDVATEIATQLTANLGIIVEIEVLEPSTFRAALAGGSAGALHLSSWTGSYPEASGFLNPLLGPGAPGQFGTTSDQLAAIIGQLDRTVGDAVKRPLIASANGALLERVPLIPIGWSARTTAFRADVDGSHASAMGTESLFTMKAGDRNQIVWLQDSEPAGLYCADETDLSALRVCAQIFEPLYTFAAGTSRPVPALAETCAPNADATTWTCTLRDAAFHRGGTLDANDVVATYAVQWDVEHQHHVGRSGAFQPWSSLFGAHLNAPDG